MRIVTAIIMALLLVGCEDGGGVTESLEAGGTVSDNNTAVGGENAEASVSAPRSEVLAESEERNIVAIRNLTPDVVTDGESVTLTFEVAYNLAGYRQGVINIGFNTWSADSYVFLDEKAIVDEGMGVETFTVEVTPKKWDEPIAFKLNVSLSEYPHPSSWTPLASAAQVIEVKAADALIQQRRMPRMQPVSMANGGVVEACY
ncbi:MAG TPA: hypothetical protein ENJ26_00285, partial [Rhodobacteraceae bacterium]|nr:hypothetical protein [Paracoccaceae bacterium]